MSSLWVIVQRVSAGWMLRVVRSSPPSPHPDNFSRASSSSSSDLQQRLHPNPPGVSFHRRPSHLRLRLDHLSSGWGWLKRAHGANACVLVCCYTAIQNAKLRAAVTAAAAAQEAHRLPLPRHRFYGATWTRDLLENLPKKSFIPIVTVGWKHLLCGAARVQINDLK